MKKMKMPIISKKVTKTPYEVYTILRDFLENDFYGLDDHTPICSGYTVADLKEVLDSLQFYLVQAHEPTILPLTFQVIDDSKLKEELKKQCQK